MLRGLLNGAEGFIYEMWATIGLRTTPEATVEIERRMMMPKQHIMFGTVRAPFPYLTSFDVGDVIWPKNRLRGNYKEREAWSAELQKLVSAALPTTGYFVKGAFDFSVEMQAHPSFARPVVRGATRWYCPYWEGEAMTANEAVFATVAVHPPMYLAGKEGRNSDIFTIPGLLDTYGLVVKETTTTRTDINGGKYKRKRRALTKVSALKNAATLVAVDAALQEGHA